jgi:hypothetical protein
MERFANFLRGALLTLSAGPDKRSCYHPNFLRGRPELVREIRRITVKGTGPRRPNNPEEEPNFYALPFLPKSSSGANNNMPAARAEREQQPHTLPLSNMGGRTGTAAESLLGLGNSTLLAQLGSLRSGLLGNTSQFLPHSSTPSSFLAPTLQTTARDFGNGLANASDQRRGLMDALAAASATGGWPHIPARDQLSDAARTAWIRECMLQQQLLAFPSLSSSFLSAGTASRLDGLASHHHNSALVGALAGGGGGGHVAPHDHMSLSSLAAPQISNELIQHFLCRQNERHSTTSTADQAGGTGGSNGGTTSADNNPNTASL